MSYIRDFGAGRGRNIDQANKRKVRKPGSSSAEEKFQQAAQQHQESIRKHAAKTDDNVAGNVEKSVSSQDQILARITSGYCSDSGDHEETSLNKTREYCDGVLCEDTSVCLVCLDSVLRTEPIWSCGSCYTIIHLQCIQQWITEGAYQSKNNLSEEHFPDKRLPWNCPKCRTDYEADKFPSRYYCYCAATADPEVDPWLLPHSCGNTCNKKLKPECGHSCLLLCHPGPCAPCPKYIMNSCHGDHKAAVNRRCSQKYWSCGSTCNKLLTCSQHRCQQPCHYGDCAPCDKNSIQSCVCKKNKQIRPCNKHVWKCDHECGRMLSCGIHRCESICHSTDECGKCPKAAKYRSCPCGKSSVENLPCTEEVPCCGDSCSKPLSCGSHRCVEKCHTGPCASCLQITVKTCRCGSRQKELPCSKEYTCDTRCQNMKPCGRHLCKRRCCDGESCPPCDQICNKKLNCNNHKCTSICHRGKCYPCNVSIEKSCNCGQTVISVPCIRAKRAQPPRCRKHCQKKSTCHHPAIQRHLCHFGDCPPCSLVCNNTYTACGHKCERSCHDVVSVKRIDPRKPAGPWEKVGGTYIEIVKQPCGPCPHPVAVTCPGKHETVNFPCHDSKPRPCGRECGRALTCGNHTCTLQCHTVLGSNDSVNSGDNCEVCEDACINPRPDGCRHICLLPCHTGACPPCEQQIRTQCFCKSVFIYMSCWEWNGNKKNKEEKLKCAGNCPRELACGHPCGKPCHSDDCQSNCQFKITLHCQCKRKKERHICSDVEALNLDVKCDNKCQEIKIANKQNNQAEEISALSSDTDGGLNEKLLPGRRQRTKKQKNQVIEESGFNYQRFIKPVSITVLVLAVIAGLIIIATSES